MTHEAYIGGSVIHPMGMSESPRNPSFRFFFIELVARRHQLDSPLPSIQRIMITLWKQMPNL